MRDNQIDEKVLETLNSRYQPDFKPDEESGYITLSSHNATARAINTEKLSELAGTVSEFQASIEGEFPEHAYPSDLDFACKERAQVMFVKNDLSVEKRFYNGKIGRITEITEEVIYVRCPGEEEDIAVTPVEWENRKYTLDEENKEVHEETIGTFTQFPLKLAWAITIHKSQGLTFERVIIDAEAAFAHGQVYVALSRCKSFEGIVLRTRLGRSSVRTDRLVQNFTEVARRKKSRETGSYWKRKREYQQALLRDFFRFPTLKAAFSRLQRFVLENKSALQGNSVSEVEILWAKAETDVFGVATKFLPRLEALSQTGSFTG